MSASSNRGVTPNQHPQLRLPLSHHGLPRAPTSPSSSFSSRSNRYEALSNPHPTTTPTTFIPHAGPKHQHHPSINSSSTTAAAPLADGSQRAASFFRYSRTGDAPPSPPMTPFSPSAFPSEASTPIILSPALPDSASQCCAHCRHCGGSVSEAAGSRQQQQRSCSVEDVPSPVRRHASTRSLKHAEPSSSFPSAESPSVSAAKPAQRRQERSHSRERSKGADRGRPEARGSDGPDAGADELKQERSLAAAPVPPPSVRVPAVPSSSSAASSSFSRMGKRIKAALGGPKKGSTTTTTTFAAVSPGVRHAGTDVAAGRKKAKRREKERERDALVEVEEVGDVHWTEM